MTGRSAPQWRWALRGKHPGAADDLGVIADSTGGRQRGELDKATRRLVPGNPGTAMSGPAALPWVMAGPVIGARTAPRLGLAILDWPREPVRDAFGRPTTMMRYVDCVFDHLADVGAGYDQLAAAVASLELPAAGPIAPVLGPPDLAATAGLINGDFAWFAAAAALLLDGALVISDALDAPVHERVRLLEALVSLLPYHVRADLSLSTHVSPLSATKIRLGFGVRSTRGARVMSWRGEVDRLTLSEPAGRYRGLLGDIRDAVGGDTVELLAKLRADEQRPGIVEPGPAVAYAETILRQVTTLADVRSGQGRPATVAQVLNRGILKAFRPGEWGLLLSDYLKHTPPAQLDAERLRRHRPSVVIPQLAARVLDAPTLDAAGLYLVLGRRLGALFPLVGEVLSAAVAQPDAGAGAERAVRVLLDLPVEPEDPRVAAAEDERLCCDVAAALILGSDPRTDLAAAFVAWLSSRPGWRCGLPLAGYVAALSDAPAEHAEPWQVPVRDAVAMLVAAAETGHLERVVTATWLSLAGASGLEPAWRRRLHAALREPGRLPDGTRAAVDVLVVALDLDGEHHAAVDVADPATYGDAARRLLDALPDDARLHVTRRFADRLSGQFRDAFTGKGPTGR